MGQRFRPDSSRALIQNTFRVEFFRSPAVRPCGRQSPGKLPLSRQNPPSAPRSGFLPPDRYRAVLKPASAWSRLYGAKKATPLRSGLLIFCTASWMKGVKPAYEIPPGPSKNWMKSGEKFSSWVFGS